MSHMTNFMAYQHVKDKIACTLKQLGLSTCPQQEEIAADTYKDVRLIVKAYARAVSEGYSEDIIDNSREGYTTLHYLMDIVIIQSIRAHAARHGVITDLVLNIQEEDPDDYTP